MLKSKKFFVILHTLYTNKVMAKKKTSKTSKEKPASTLSEALDLKNIFHNERTNFIFGAALFIVSGLMVWAFVSYLATGSADISIIETPRDGEILNQNHEFQNACGSLGAYTSWFFIKRCFGLAAFLIPIYIFLISLRLVRAYNVKLLKWFMCLAIIMIWCSVTFAKFLEPLFDSACYNPGGDHGLAISQQIEGFVGTPGLTALLALVAISFLAYLSMETITFIRKIFNPLRYLKKIPMTIHVGSGESTEEPEHEEEPEPVYDNPYREEIEFPIDETPSTPIMPSQPQPPTIKEQ